MPDPFAFPASTPALNLPLLAAGQAQKEFFVNEALSLLDALHPRAVIASQPSPPSTAAEGDCFRITSPASGAWNGHAGKVAVMVAGAWHFIAPAPGLLLFDQAAGQLIVFRSQWQAVANLAAPTGGNVIDVEARAAISALLAGLRAVGLLPAPPA